MVRHWQHAVLLAIVLGATALSAYWAFLVPIYQAPDEPLHLDYALGLNARRGLFRARHSPPPVMNNRFENVYTHDYVHPVTNYLLDRSGAGPIVFNVPAKVAPDYGSAEYFACLDRDAPAWGDIRVHEAPFLFRLYPVGYYALLAVWIELLRLMNPGVTFVFFGARLLSVALLAGTLLFSYGTLRALRVARGWSLAITAVIGFFPLTSFISSYVQPDNLSLFLTSACFYLSLQVRRRPGAWRNYCLLGLAFGALAVTKLHYFAAVAVPVAGLLAAELLRAPLSWRRRLRFVALLVTPVLGTMGLQARMQGDAVYRFRVPPTPLTPVQHTLTWTRKAFEDFYIGLTHQSFWGRFGWLDTPLVIHDENFTKWLRRGGTALGLAFLALTLVRGAQVASRLLRLPGRGRSRLAWRLAFSNPVLNSYFLFTLLMFVLFVHYENTFGGQGRNWLPFLLPFCLTGAVYVPKLLRRPRQRLIFAAGVLAALLAFDGIGGYYAVAAVSRRYYASFHGLPMRRVALTSACQSMREKQPLTFAVLEPAYVYGLQLTFQFTHSERYPSRLRIAWRCPSGAEHLETFHVIHDRHVRTLTVPVEGVIDELWLETEGDPSRLDVYKLELLCR